MDKKIIKCDLCSRGFTLRSSLKRHCRTVHRLNVTKSFKDPKTPPVCDVCNKTFHSHSYVRRHKKKVHENKILNAKEKPQRLITKCSKANLKRKYKCSKSLRVSALPKKSFKCDVCDNTFSYYCNLVRHKKNLHKIPRSLIKPISKVLYNCSECSSSFPTKTIFLDHFVVDHPDIKIENSVMHFQNHNQFLKWKLFTEEKTGSLYKLKSRFKTLKSVIHSYECNRSGDFKSRSKGIRHIKWSGTIKCGAFCPARMVYEVPLGQENITVKFTSTHVGHQIKNERLRLSNTDEDDVAVQLLSDVLKQEEGLRQMKNQELQLTYDPLGNFEEICNFPTNNQNTYKSVIESELQEVDSFSSTYSSENQHTEKSAIESELQMVDSSSSNISTENQHINSAITFELQKVDSSSMLKAEAQKAVLDVSDLLESCTTDDEYKLIINSMKTLESNLQALKKPSLPPLIFIFTPGNPSIINIQQQAFPAK